MRPLVGSGYTKNEIPEGLGHISRKQGAARIIPIAPEIALWTQTVDKSLASEVESYL